MTALEDARTLERFEVLKDRQAFVTFTNPIDNETILKKRVIDISERGLSIRTSFNSKLYDQGRTFKDLKIYVENKLEKSVDVRSIYQRQFIDDSGNSFYQIGLSIIDPKAESANS